jgi:transcriptional regulator with XRE-family HTH domain
MEEGIMIGERIAKSREKMGLTQTELAQIIGVAQSRISEFERGIKTDCNISTAKRLARALGVGVDYLIGTWEDDAEPAASAAAGASASPGAPARRRGRPRTAAPAAARG